MYTETRSDFALARIFYCLKRNRLSLKKVCLILLWNRFFNKTFVYVCIMKNMANCILIVFFFHLTLSTICGLHRIAIACNLFFFTLFRSPSPPPPKKKASLGVVLPHCHEFHLPVKQNTSELNFVPVLTN